jgi:hypothetical protein
MLYTSSRSLGKQAAYTGRRPDMLTARQVWPIYRSTGYLHTPHCRSSWRSFKQKRHDTMASVIRCFYVSFHRRHS